MQRNRRGRTISRAKRALGKVAAAAIEQHLLDRQENGGVPPALLKEATALFLKGYGTGEPQQQRPQRHRIWGNGILSSAPPQTTLSQKVYVIGATGNPVKIGIALDVQSRRRELQVGHPHTLNIYLETDAKNARDVERECHARLKANRLSGEWFDISPDLAIETVEAVITERL